MNARDTTKVYICGGLKEQCSRFILNLQKNLDEYFIIYISATAALYFKVLGYLLLTSLMRNYIPKRASGAPIYTLSKLYDVSFGCVTPPHLWQCIAYFRLPKGGYWSISDYSSCSFITKVVLHYIGTIS